MTTTSRIVKKLCSRVGATLLALALPAAAASAQCAMCQTSAANSDPAGIKYLNIATVLLLVPPVALFCVFFLLAYTRRRAPEEEASREEAARSGEPRRARASSRRDFFARLRSSN
ncbi:MAG: hypothetical protein ABR563_06765 [Pyrinomonadaceae bacterium]